MGRKWLSKEDCKYCRNEKGYVINASNNKNEYINVKEIYIKQTDFKYCPYCGRKLVEE